MDENVILKLNDGSIQKFIYGTDQNDKEYVISVPLSYHRDINQYSREELNLDLKNISGGYIQRNGSNFSIFGISESYGKAQMENVKRTLEDRLKGVEVKIQSDQGRDLEKKVEAFLKFKNSLVSSLDKEGVELTNTENPKLGYDYLKVFGCENRDDLSLILYGTETGGSFGFDTIYLAYKDDSKVKITPLIIERYYISNIKGFVDKNRNLGLIYSVEGKNKEEEFDVSNPSEITTKVSLNDIDQILLNQSMSIGRGIPFLSETIYEDLTPKSGPTKEQEESKVFQEIKQKKLSLTDRIKRLF